MVHNLYVIEPANWVNIIAITKSKDVILVRQYRHGSETVTLEIPGGMVDDGESPEEAAKRELLEETGYSSRDLTLLGVCEPNPAIQNNLCYTFLATDVELEKEQKMDSTEDIEVILCPLKEIGEMIVKREITHALVIAAFHYYSVYKG
ncbi:MAG: NUDIX hydrolase [Blastocatellia bacterium]|nr:NUDIX hydrolase [Blastocatellia bacterium]